MKTVAGLIFAVLAIILINVYREGGPDGLRSWVKAKFTNQPDQRPGAHRSARRTVVRRPGRQRQRAGARG